MDMQFTPSMFKVIYKAEIEFISTRRVGETGTKLLEEVNLAVDTNCCY